MRERIAVITENHAKYREYQKKQDYETGRKLVYINEPLRVKGLSIVDIVFYGSWYERKDIAEIVETLYTANYENEQLRKKLENILLLRS